MAEFFHAIRQIINGTRLINNRNKYEAIGYGIAVVHTFFAITFFGCSIVPLGIYNVIAVAFYLHFALVLSRKERYLAIYISAFVEILGYASACTILVGWDWGFMVYTISLVPIAFYLSYTMPGFERRMAPPILVSVAVAVNYMIVDILMRHINPIYAGPYNEKLVMFCYCFNTVLAFALLLFFSMLFALEVRHMQYQLERENSKLGEIANFDPLTRLLNRRSMSNYMRKAFDEAQKTNEAFCLIMIDIDDFKRVNDTYGHAAGDQVLIMVSESISRSVRENDFVCRWGGEEILVLLMTDKVNAEKTAERIRKDIVNTVINEKESEIRVSVTMGIAQYEARKTIRDMIDEADEKLYYGKKHGKNQVVV